MASIKIVGDAIVITSERTLEELKTLQKYSPKALVLTEVDSNGNAHEYFRVAVVSEGPGSFNQFGAVFAKTSSSGDGKASITIPFEFKDGDDAVGIVSDKFGTAILNLNKVEEGFATAMDKVRVNQAAILRNIELV